MVYRKSCVRFQTVTDYCSLCRVPEYQGVYLPNVLMVQKADTNRGVNIDFSLTFGNQMLVYCLSHNPY